MRKLLLASCVGLVCASAHAQGFSVGVQGGTLGAGLLAEATINRHFDARLGVNALSYSYNTNSGGVAYSGHLKLQTFEVLGDWHPWASSSFRLTAGALVNNNKFDLTGQSSGGAYTFNGVTYTAAQAGSVSAQVTFNQAAPYVGIGWGGDNGSAGLHFSSDIGVAYQGSPRARITATGAASNAALASNVAAAQSKLQSDLSSFRYYPVVELGLTYRF